MQLTYLVYPAPPYSLAAEPLVHSEANLEIDNLEINQEHPPSRSFHAHHTLPGKVSGQA